MFSFSLFLFHAMIDVFTLQSHSQGWISLTFTRPYVQDFKTNVSPFRFLSIVVVRIWIMPRITPYLAGLR